MRVWKGGLVGGGELLVSLGDGERGGCGGCPGVSVGGSSDQGWEREDQSMDLGGALVAHCRYFPVTFYDQTAQFQKKIPIQFQF